MSNPLNKYFQNNALVKYGQVVAVVLSELRVEVEGKLIRLPIEYLGGLRNQDVKSYAVSQGLSSTLKFSTLSIVTEAVPNRNKNKLFGDRLEKQPLPVDLTYEYNLRFKKFTDMSKALEQIVFHMYPHMTLKYQGLGRGDENLIISVESYDWDNEWAGEGEQPAYYNLSFNIVVSGGHFYGRNLLEDEDGSNGVIREVDILAGLYNDIPKQEQLSPLFTMYDEESAPSDFVFVDQLKQTSGYYVMYEGEEDNDRYYKNIFLTTEFNPFLDLEKIEEWDEFFNNEFSIRMS